MVLCFYGPPSLFPVVSGRSFVSYRARKLKIISFAPTCVALLYFGKTFFFLHSGICGLLSFGSTKNIMVVFFLNVLLFTSRTCRVLTIQPGQNITAYSISSDKSVLRV